MLFRGFTLLEILIALAIASILLTLGIPAFHNLVLDSRRTADVNALVASVQLARSEAAKRALPVTLCKSANGIDCGDREVHFDDGWLVRVEAPESDVLLSYQPAMHGQIRSNRAAFTFRPNFRRGTNGTVTFCDQRGGASARAVVISYTGRPRVAAADSRGDHLDCAR